MFKESTPEENKDRHVIERCGGFSLLLCYLNILMRPAQATNTAIKIIALVSLRACSSVAVTVTDPIKLLLVLISSILQIKGFSGVFNAQNQYTTIQYKMNQPPVIKKPHVQRELHCGAFINGAFYMQQHKQPIQQSK